MHYTLSISFSGIDSRAVPRKLGKQGIYLNVGSACSKDKRSRILEAVGLEISCRRMTKTDGQPSQTECTILAYGIGNNVSGYYSHQNTQLIKDAVSQSLSRLMVEHINNHTGQVERHYIDLVNRRVSINHSAGLDLHNLICVDGTKCTSFGYKRGFAPAVEYSPRNTQSIKAALISGSESVTVTEPFPLTHKIDLGPYVAGKCRCLAKTCLQVSPLAVRMRSADQPQHKAITSLAFGGPSFTFGSLTLTLERSNRPTPTPLYFFGRIRKE